MMTHACSSSIRSRQGIMQTGGEPRIYNKLQFQERKKKRQLQKERLRRNPIFLTSHNGNQALFPSKCYQRRPIQKLGLPFYLPHTMSYVRSYEDLELVPSHIMNRFFFSKQESITEALCLLDTARNFTMTQEEWGLPILLDISRNTWEAVRGHRLPPRQSKVNDANERNMTCH